MKRTIELKHVGPKDHVRRLLEELIDRLEAKLDHGANDAASVHVVFEEERAHRLFRASLTCHVPGHILAAHEERRDPGTTIREAFAEVERQLEKQKTHFQEKRLRTSLKQVAEVRETGGNEEGTS